MRSILADESNANWSAEQVHDFLGWALDRFCIHTAPLKTVTVVDGSLRTDATPYDFTVDTDIELPDDIFEALSVGSRVYATDTAGNLTYYDPIKRTPGLHANRPTEASFWVWPEETLNLNAAPGTGASVTIEYFAYYEKPAIDNDAAIIRIPRWAEKPLATLIGAMALEPTGIQSATIDRWKIDDDSGNPEQNALRAQQQFLLRHYEYEISKHPSQDRANFFREYEDTQW